jgi:hypothetical protein
MSKGISVAKAIGAQLRFEGRWPPNDDNKVMGKDYHYTDAPANTIGDFLNGLRTRIYQGTPKYYFQFDNAFAVKALSQSVSELTGSVTSKTSDTEPPGWSNP